MDEIDLQIVAELMEDARKPFREIAKKLGVSTQTVIKRYNALKEKGTIQICSISIDPNKIGYEGIADLLITCHPGGNLSEAIDQLKKTQNIIIATRAIGDFEGYAVLIFKDAKDLYERVHQIKNLPEIEKVEVSFTTPVIMSVPPITKPPTSLTKTYDETSLIF
jgi:Lrp/AsnC family transcriptional regulator for asnA, asnC and gidA